MESRDGGNGGATSSWYLNSGGGGLAGADLPQLKRLRGVMKVAGLVGGGVTLQLAVNDMNVLIAWLLD